MSLRPLALVPLLASGVLAAPAAADRLLVAGPDGVVMQADTDLGVNQGVFEYFACQCSGPIQALAADGQRLYAADEFGQLLVFDVHDGDMLALFSTGLVQINALAAARGSVFAGLEDGTVARIDPLTGQVLGSRKVAAGVRALRAHNGFLFAAGADGAIYRAPVNQGDFNYFTCFCFFDIRDMAIIGGDLLVGDGNGIVARVSSHTGDIITAFFVGQMTSMTAIGNALFFYYESNEAPGMVDAMTGEPLGGGWASPIAVNAMLVIPDPPVAVNPIQLPRGAGQRP